jgi:hypothetical protein
MISGVNAVPYQPACQAPSISGAIMNPNRPMIDGAAIGVRNTLLRASQASWSSATASSSRRRYTPAWFPSLVGRKAGSYGCAAMSASPLELGPPH